MFGRLLQVLAARFRPATTVAGAADRVTPQVEQGIAHMNRGDYVEATISFERALAIDPTSISALHGRALMHHLAGENQEALEVCDELLVRAPGHVEAWSTRALAARSLGLLDEALASFRQAAAIEPRSGLISCVGGILFQQGRIAEALAETDRALAIDPEADFIHSNRLFILNHDRRVDRRSLARAHFEWGRQVEARMALHRVAHTNDRDPHRRLRIGYVSADLRGHSVAFFIAPVLEHHDRAAVEVVCYDNQGGVGDAFTERLRLHADQWIKTSGMDDAAMAARIREDRIDILIDLSGHTGGNRLPVFAMKPAPVTATWFGYMNTTGLSVMDYRITDAGMCPPGSEPYYSEMLFRVPSAAAWSAAPDSPEPGPLPVMTNRHIRFGSFNNWAKVSDRVIEAWCRVLAQTPGAVLLVLAAGGDTESVRDAIHVRFARHGIDADRLEIGGTRSLDDFLRAVATVDIALDPFPYNGGTTTLHTLWMGVPVVSMRGDEEVGRASLGILYWTGIGDLCAVDAQSYYQAATGLAADTDRFDLAETRIAGPHGRQSVDERG